MSERKVLFGAALGTAITQADDVVRGARLFPFGFFSTSRHPMLPPRIVPCSSIVIALAPGCGKTLRCGLTILHGAEILFKLCVGLSAGQGGFAL